MTTARGGPFHRVAFCAIDKTFMDGPRHLPHWSSTYQAWRNFPEPRMILRSSNRITVTAPVCRVQTARDDCFASGTAFGRADLSISPVDMHLELMLQRVSLIVERSRWRLCLKALSSN